MLISVNQLLHSTIDSTEKRMTQSNGKYTLVLRCKDLQQLELEFNSGDDCLDVASSIEKLSHIGMEVVKLFTKHSHHIKNALL